MLSFEKMFDQYGHRRQHIASCFMVTTIISLVRPYKKLAHNLVEILLMTLITFMVSYITQVTTSVQKANYFQDSLDQALMIVVLLLVPHLMFALTIVYKLLYLLKCQLVQSYNCRLMNKIPWLDVVWSKLNKAITGGKDQTLTATVSYGTI